MSCAAQGVLLELPKIIIAAPHHLLFLLFLPGMPNGGGWSHGRQAGSRGSGSGQWKLSSQQVARGSEQHTPWGPNLPPLPTLWSLLLPHLASWMVLCIGMH